MREDKAGIRQRPKPPRWPPVELGRGDQDCPEWLEVLLRRLVAAAMVSARERERD